MHPAPDQPARRIRADPRKMQLRHRRRAGFRGAEVAGTVGPAAPPTGPEQHDGAFGNAGVRPLPGLEIGGDDAVVPVRFRLSGDVDHERGSDELRQRQLVSRVLAFGEVHGGVEVGAAVLRRGEVVRCVVIARRGALRRNHLEPERFGGRPVDGCRVEGVGQVDPGGAGEELRQSRTGTGGEARDPRSENEAAIHEFGSRRIPALKGALGACASLKDSPPAEPGLSTRDSIMQPPSELATRPPDARMLA